MRGKKRPVISSRCEAFESASEAGRALYVHPSSIVKAIGHGGKSAGRRWAYCDQPLPRGFADEGTCREAVRKAAILAHLQADPSDRRHGTLYGYSLGCRCRKCKVARGMRDAVEVAR